MSAAGSVPGCVAILVQPEADAGRVQKARGALSVLAYSGWGHAPPAFEPADTACRGVVRLVPLRVAERGRQWRPQRSAPPARRERRRCRKLGRQSGRTRMPPPSRPDAFGRSFRALLSPRPYRDMNAHAVGFMTIRQVMWVFDFSQIQASAKLQRTQETMCALVAACRHAPPVCEPNRCRVPRRDARYRAGAARRARAGMTVLKPRRAR